MRRRAAALLAACAFVAIGAPRAHGTPKPFGTFGTSSAYTLPARLTTEPAPHVSICAPACPVYGNVLMVGDSLTVGLGASDARRGYAQDLLSVLATDNPASAWRSLVQGRTGASAAQTLRDEQVLGLTPTNASLIVVEVGTNDWGEMSAAAFTGYYQQLISALVAGSTTARLVCLGLWRAPGAVGGGGDTTTAYDNAIWSTCMAALPAGQVSALDLSQLYAQPAYHDGVAPSSGADTFHPNDAGYAAVCDEVTAALYGG